MATSETAALVAFPFVACLDPAAAPDYTSVSWKSINAKLNDLRNLSAHRVFCAVLEVGAVFFKGIRWMFVGTSAVIVTVTQVTLHGVDTVKPETEQEANGEDVCVAHGCSTTVLSLAGASILQRAEITGDRVLLDHRW